MKLKGKSPGKDQVNSERSIIDSLLHSVVEGIVLMDKNFMIELINPSAKKMLKYLTGKKRSKKLESLGNIPVKEFVEEIFDGREKLITKIAQAVDGSGKLFEISASALKGCSKEITGVVLILRDKTDEIRTQEHIFQTAKLVSIGELASGVAHEINNPLAGIIGYSELLLEMDLSPEHKKYVEKIYREATRAKEIVRNLLLFARRQSTEDNYFNLNGVIKSSAELVEKQLSLDGILIDLSLDESIPLIYGSEGEIQQVFLTFIQNSHDAIMSSKKGSKIKIETRNLNNRAVRVTVTDDGPGIPEEYKERVFNPFFTTKPVGKGTGLGLSIVYKIVMKHDGKIWIEQGKKGCTFVMEFPLKNLKSV